MLSRTFVLPKSKVILSLFALSTTFVPRTAFATSSSLTASNPNNSSINSSFISSSEKSQGDQDMGVTYEPLTKIDDEYKGTAVARVQQIHRRISKLSPDTLSQDWVSVVRPKILWAGGMKDLRSPTPGRGYTGHSFNDHNHCDLTAMRMNVADNEHRGGIIPGIAEGNPLGAGIRIASYTLKEMMEEDGDQDLAHVDTSEETGSWSTCMSGCNSDPPNDVAHIQFQSRIAFKLVWCPPSFTSFVLVDDAGHLLASGTPQGHLPMLQERMYNYHLVKGSKYETAALELASQGAHRPSDRNEL